MVTCGSCGGPSELGAEIAVAWRWTACLNALAHCIQHTTLDSRQRLHSLHSIYHSCEWRHRPSRDVDRRWCGAAQRQHLSLRKSPQAVAQRRQSRASIVMTACPRMDARSGPNGSTSAARSMSAVGGQRSCATRRGDGTTVDRAAPCSLSNSSRSAASRVVTSAGPSATSGPCDRHVQPPGRLGPTHRGFSQKQLKQVDTGMRAAACRQAGCRNLAGCVGRMGKPRACLDVRWRRRTEPKEPPKRVRSYHDRSSETPVGTSGPPALTAAP